MSFEAGISSRRNLGGRRGKSEEHSQSLCNERVTTPAGQRTSEVILDSKGFGNNHRASAVPTPETRNPAPEPPSLIRTPMIAAIPDFAGLKHTDRCRMLLPAPHSPQFTLPHLFQNIRLGFPRQRQNGGSEGQAPTVADTTCFRTQYPSQRPIHKRMNPQLVFDRPLRRVGSLPEIPSARNSPTEPHEGQQDGLNSVHNVTLKPLHWRLILANFPRQIGPNFAILNRLYVRFRVRVL
jgi:hypothetical protein